ncbi:MAG: hypothetical protein Q9P14_17680 [candidate division KSB1 bacterium]|nr:hypothetical protein [candidate division KSB1 bacterium]
MGFTIAFRDVSFDFVDYGGVFFLVDDLRKAIVSVPIRMEGKALLWLNLFEERSHLSLSYQKVAAELSAALNSKGIGRDIDHVIQSEFISKNYHSCARTTRTKPVHSS